MPLSRLRKAIEECCSHLASSVHIRWAPGSRLPFPACPRETRTEVRGTACEGRTRAPLRACGEGCSVWQGSPGLEAEERC